jgi:long-chain fatty acid transport protein
LGSTMAIAEGLERVNLDPSFMFEPGTYAEFSYGSVNPSIPTGGAAVRDNVAGSFTVNNFAAKTSLGDSLDLGIWSTSNGNGASIDWGTTPNGVVKAELTIPTMAALVRYRINDNISIIGGLKRSTVDDGGLLKLPITAVTAGGTWNISSASTTAAVYGVAYEMPEIAMRVSVVAEASSSLDIDTSYTIAETGATVHTGVSKASIGDATTLSFQSGIAADTLLFGSVRVSSWKNNQVSVPHPTLGPKDISSFGDGSSYTVGLGRKFSDKLSGSVSYFSDPASDCKPTSALSPICENTSINLGAKYSLSDSATLSLGTTWTQYGDASAFGGAATTTKSTKTSYGFKLSYKF